MRRLTLIAGTLLFCAASFAAWAQKGPDFGDHDWIKENPEYRSEFGVHCCDKSHCHPLNNSDVVERDGGYFFKPTEQFFQEGQPGVHQSKTFQFMGCGTPYRLWCFFIAVRGV